MQEIHPTGTHPGEVALPWTDRIRQSTHHCESGQLTSSGEKKRWDAPVNLVPLSKGGRSIGYAVCILAPSQSTKP